jgi:hypothetical protein
LSYSLPTEKITKDGQPLDAIAKSHGIKDAKAIWSHKGNQKLAKLRKDPKAIKKGDVIVLPMPVAYKKAIDDQVVEYSKVIMQVTAHRKQLIAEIDNAEKNLGKLSKLRAAILELNDTEVAKLDKAANLALEKRAQADFIQNVLTVHKMAIKAGVKGAAQTGKLGLTLQKSAENTKTLGMVAKWMKNAGYFKAVSPTWSPAIEIALDVTRGMSAFAIDMGADASSAESSLGKALKFLDDATSITHYLWMGTRAAETGKVSWDSIEEDKKKSIKRLWGKVRDALGAVVDTENLNNKLIEGHKAQLKKIDKDLAAMQKHTLHLIALSKL